MQQTLAYHVSSLRRDFTEYCQVHLQEMGLSQGLLFFLIYTGRHPNCTPKEIAAALHMDMGHTTRSLFKLTQSGFLLQSSDPRDKRSHILTLTPKGEYTFQEIHALFTKWDQKVMASFSQEERLLLLDLLSRLTVSKYKEEH